MRIFEILLAGITTAMCIRVLYYTNMATGQLHYGALLVLVATMLFTLYTLSQGK